MSTSSAEISPPPIRSTPPSPASTPSSSCGPRPPPPPPRLPPHRLGRRSRTARLHLPDLPRPHGTPPGAVPRLGRRQPRRVPAALARLLLLQQFDRSQDRPRVVMRRPRRHHPRREH